MTLFACGEQDTNSLTDEELSIEAPREIKWEALIPLGFEPDTIAAKYMPLLEAFEDDDPKADETYQQMMSEINSAPLNTEMQDKNIKIGGFIAPLAYSEGNIVQFLLVPYFGACIHVPPPPSNQIILVKTAEGQAIDGDMAYYPVWVSGMIKVDKQTTEFGEAGYQISDAITELYEYTVL